MTLIVSHDQMMAVIGQEKYRFTPKNPGDLISPCHGCRMGPRLVCAYCIRSSRRDRQNGIWKRVPGPARRGA